MLNFYCMDQIRMNSDSRSCSFGATSVLLRSLHGSGGLGEMTREMPIESRWAAFLGVLFCNSAMDISLAKTFAGGPIFNQQGPAGPKAQFTSGAHTATVARSTGMAACFRPSLAYAAARCLLASALPGSACKSNLAHSRIALPGDESLIPRPRLGQRGNRSLFP